MSQPKLPKPMFCWLFFLPVIFILLTLHLKSALGPYWLGSNLDPSYQYLMNGLNILFGLAPAHVDHPGTTLQLLSAAVIRVAAGGRSGDALLQHIFTEPEYYIHVIWVVLFVLSVLSMVVLGGYVYRRTQSVLWAMMAQLPALLFVSIKSYNATEAVLPISVNVNPEHVFIIVAHGFALLILRLFFHRDQKAMPWTAAGLGLVAACGLVTKLTFIPLVIGAFLIVRGVVPKLMCGISFLVGFIMFTWPIRERYGKWWEWIYKNASHAGEHGTGEAAIVKVNALFSNIGTLMTSNALFSVLFALGLIGLGVSLVQWMKGACKDKTVLRYQWGCVLMIVAQLFLVGRSYMSLHYMAPCLMLLGIVFVTSYANHPSRWIPKALLVIICFGSIFSIGHGWAYQLKLAERETELLQFAEETIPEVEGRCLVVPYYRASNQKYAIKFGLYAFQSAPYERYIATLSQLYRNPFHVNVWSMNIVDFQAKYFFGPMYQQMTERVPCVVFHGTAPMDPNMVKTKAVASSENGVEHVYRVLELK